MPSRRADSEVPPLSVAFHQAWQELRADYHAGTTGRFRPTLTGVSPIGSGADYHYRSEAHFLRMLERARHFDRNEPIVSSGLDRLTSNVVQEGFTLDVKTGDEALDADLNARWYEWADDPDACDYEGEKTFAEQESLAFRAMPADGDMLVLPLGSGHLQNVEAHRVRTPMRTEQNVFCGVKLDPDSRRRQEYWITKEDVDPLRAVAHVRDVQKVKVRDKNGRRQVLHLYHPKRFSQTRGVTALAPPVDYIGVHGDLQYATLVKAQVAACYAILEEIHPEADEATALALDASAQTGAKREETLEDGTTATMMGVYPGMRVRGKRGRVLKGFAPNIPNPEFFPHAFLILTFIAISLDIPVHVLLLDASKTNFSGWRGAIDEARKKFRVWQRRMVPKYHSPIYRWKVRQWLAKDFALAKAAQRSDIDIFGHCWHPPAWRYIEPNKDATAELVVLSNAQNSRRRVFADKGLEWAEVAPEVAADNGLFIELMSAKAKELNQKFTGEPGFPITWRDVAALPIAQGLSGKLGEGQTAEDGEGAEGTAGTKRKEGASV